MNTVQAVARKFFSFYKNRKLRALGTEPVWQKVPAGVEMLITPTEWLDQRMLFGVYEPWLKKIIEMTVRKGEACIDIGTHKGYFTLIMAKQTGPEGKVVSIDPDPRVFERLDQNCERNGFHWVERHPLALGETEGSIELELNPKPGDSSRFHRQSVNLGQVRSVHVPMKTLDQLLEETGFFENRKALSFIKMDAEGSEPLIWQGMKKTLETYNPVVFTEFHFDCLKAAGTSAQEFKDQLESEGWLVNRVTWSYDLLFRGMVFMNPLEFTDQEKDTVDALLIKRDSPYFLRLDEFIAEYDEEKDEPVKNLETTD